MAGHLFYDLLKYIGKAIALGKQPRNRIQRRSLPLRSFPGQILFRHQSHR